MCGRPDAEGVVLCLCLGMMSCCCIRILPETGLRDTIRRDIKEQGLRGNADDKVYKLRIVIWYLVSMSTVSI